MSNATKSASPDKVQTKQYSAKIATAMINLELPVDAPMSDVINEFMELVKENPEKYIEVHPRYTSRTMLNEIRKCHAKAIGCPKNSELQADAKAALDREGIDPNAKLTPKQPKAVAVETDEKHVSKADAKGAKQSTSKVNKVAKKAAKPADLSNVNDDDVDELLGDMAAASGSDAQAE